MIDLLWSRYAAMYSPNNTWSTQADYGWVVDDTKHALPTRREFYDDLFANGTKAGMVMVREHKKKGSATRHVCLK
jgi:hypothetical protein